MPMLHILTSMFGWLALLAIMAGGFVLMFSPVHGRRILKNTAVSIGLFILASMLASWLCSRYFR
jgi:hypothetical protein